jgi:hypothetical protein
VTGLKMLMVQSGLPPPESVKLTGRLSRVASERASAVRC